VAGEHFTILGPLGKGSFGVVWEAQPQRGVATCALKEMRCKSEAEVTKVQAEGQVLGVVRRDVVSAGLPAQRVPSMVAMEAEQTEQGKWQVRLAMSLVPGVALESVLEKCRKDAKSRLQSASVEPQEFARACLYTGQLLLQLAPVLDAFSSSVYHRDITPRNIQVHEPEGSGCPEFGLVDFGLAVEAKKWRAGEAGTGGLAGDGRYWPASSWFVFCFGTRALERDDILRAEYRKNLDAHSLGLTALRCFVEMMPAQLGSGAVARALQRLCITWQHYWSDAKRLWQPIFDAFRGNGNFDEVRAKFTKARVHSIVSDDLCKLREALRELSRACTELPFDSGLAGVPPLCEALLMMIQPGRVDEEAASAWSPEVLASSPASRRSSRPPSKSSGAHRREPSASTASPSSNCSTGSSGSSGFGM